jgi:hypothetical protein
MSDAAGQASDSQLRQDMLGRLYEAYRAEGIYRGVVAKKELGKQFGLSAAVLERNLEYLLDRELIRMHKIEDLISITTSGIDCIESGDDQPPGRRVEQALERIEKLLASILNRLDKNS